MQVHCQTPVRQIPAPCRLASPGKYAPKRTHAVAARALDVTAIGCAVPSLIDLQAGKRTRMRMMITKRVGGITLCSKGFRSFGIYPARLCSAVFGSSDGAQNRDELSLATPKLARMAVVACGVFPSLGGQNRYSRLSRPLRRSTRVGPSSANTCQMRRRRCGVHR